MHFSNSKLSEQEQSVKSISDERPLKRCKNNLCGKMGHLEKDCRKKEADLKKKIREKAELTLIKEAKRSRKRVGRVCR